MKAEDFFKAFVPIENHLFGLAENFDRRQGFLNLLQHLQSKNLLPKDSLTDLNLVWHTRNILVSSPSGEPPISDETSNALGRLKQTLGL